MAKEHDALDEIHEQLGQFADELEGNRALQLFFFSPRFSTEEKKEGIDRIIEGGDERFVRFLKLVVEQHRAPVLPRIRRAFDDLWREENRLLSVSVTTAVELDESTLEQLGERIRERTRRRIELDSEVDPDLLGGIVLRVGNKVLDASVRGRLERLRREIARAA